MGKNNAKLCLFCRLLQHACFMFVPSCGMADAFCILETEKGGEFPMSS